MSAPTDTQRARAEHLRQTGYIDQTSLIDEDGAGVHSLPVSRPADDRYQDLGELARGGMGAIIESRDARIGRTVARKVLSLAEADTRATEEFINEARITGQLEHPNIVPIYDLEVPEDGSSCSFTMKRISGQTLLQLIEDLHMSDFDVQKLDDIIRVIIRVCETLSFAHQRGVIHRDIKPHNIMVGEFGQIYVMDWGIALISEPADPRLALDLPERRPGKPDVIVGTLAYMAPEQCLGDDSHIDVRTDVFGLGALLYQVLTSYPPYLGVDVKAVYAEAKACDIADPRYLCPDLELPPAICEITMQALARDPDERFQNPSELQAALRDFLRGGGWFSTRSFEAGEEIIREGETGDAGFVISSGRCEVYRMRRDHKQVVATLGPGEVFGELAILHDCLRTASVVALEPTTVKVITAEDFDRELARNSWLRSIVTQLSRRFVEQADDEAD